MPRSILVTPRSLTEAGLGTIPELRPLAEAGYVLVGGPPGRLPDLAHLRSVPPGVEGWLAGVEPIGEEELELFPALRVVSRNGAGSDAIDQSASARRGITVVTARGANARGVAELTVAHVLNGLRMIPAAHEHMRAGEWTRTLGRELPDVTVGIVGFGAVGHLVGSMLSSLGASVVAFDPFTVMAEGSPVRRMPLDEVLAASDVVSLHSPPPADGSSLIGARELSLLPPGSVLVNTARSALVDTAAVLAALDDGTLAAYAVDAFDTEPPELTPLLRHERTILSPHLGGYTEASMRRATEQAVANLLAILTPDK